MEALSSSQLAVPSKTFCLSPAQTHDELQPSGERHYGRSFPFALSRGLSKSCHSRGIKRLKTKWHNVAFWTSYGSNALSHYHCSGLHKTNLPEGLLLHHRCLLLLFSREEKLYAFLGCEKRVASSRRTKLRSESLFLSSDAMVFLKMVLFFRKSFAISDVVIQIKLLTFQRNAEESKRCAFCTFKHLGKEYGTWPSTLFNAWVGTEIDRWASCLAWRWQR